MRLSGLTLGTCLLLFTIFLPVCAQTCDDNGEENDFAVCKLETMIDIRSNCTVNVIETYTLPPGPKNFTRYVTPLKVSDNIKKCNLSYTVKADGDRIEAPDVADCVQIVQIKFSASDYTAVEIEYEFSAGAIQILDVPNQYYRRRISLVRWGFQSNTIRQINELIVRVHSRGLATVDFIDADSETVSNVGAGAGAEEDNPNQEKELTLKGVTTPKVVLVRLLNNQEICPSLQVDGRGTPLWAWLTITAASVLAIVIWLFCSCRKSSGPAPTIEHVPLTVNNPRRPMSPRPVVSPENSPQHYPGFRQRTPAQEQQASPELI